MGRGERNKERVKSTIIVGLVIIIIMLLVLVVNFSPLGEKINAFIVGLSPSLQCPYGNQIQNLVTCDYRFAKQGAYFEVDLDHVGVETTNAFTIHGSALGATEGDTVEMFLNYTDDEIRTELDRYLRNKPELDVNTYSLLVLDMEHPVHLGRDFREYLDNDPYPFELIASNFERRINIAREKFPNAKIALWATISPHSKGGGANFPLTMEAYRRAGELGVYDNLDYFLPILYQRWGQDDSVNYMIWNSRMTRQGIEQSASLTTSNGESLPIATMLSTRIYNTASRNDRELLLEADVLNQIGIIQGYDEVEIVAFWEDQYQDENVIAEWMEDVKPVPCSCMTN